MRLFQASDFVQDNRLQRGHQSGEPQGLKSSILHIHQGAGDPHNSVSLLRCGQPRSVETMEAEVIKNKTSYINKIQQGSITH